MQSTAPFFDKLKVSLFNEMLIGAYPCPPKGFPRGSDDKGSACNAGDSGSVTGSGRSPEEGNSYPLQYSGLENSMDCIVHGVAESDATEWLSLSLS